MGDPAGAAIDWDALAPGSDYSTPEGTVAYDRWFRAKVEASLTDPRPSIPHNVDIAKLREIIAGKSSKNR